MKSYLNYNAFAKSINLTRHLSQKGGSKSYFTSHPSNNNSKSKDKKDSNRIIKANIKFPTNQRSAEKDGKRKLEISPQVFQRAIDSFFIYIKNTYPSDLYQDLKIKFYEELSKEITKKENKNLRLSCEMNNFEVDSETSNNNCTSSININNNYVKSMLNNHSGNNSITQKKHSLYTLTKNKWNNKTTSNSKSNSIDKQKPSTNSTSMSKKKIIKPSTNQKKIETIKNIITKNTVKNYSKESLLNANGKTTTNYTRNLSGSKPITNSHKKNPKNSVTNIKKESYHYAQSFKELPSNSNKLEKIINQENDEDFKNSEQLREIKSSLDENLKVMFNFSYEMFLNKESESESRKSFEDGNYKTNTNSHRGIKKKNEKLGCVAYHRRHEY